MDKNTLFYAKTKEAYAIKVVAETLQKDMNDGCLVINKGGIFFEGLDKYVGTTKLTKLSLYKDKFNNFYYNSPEKNIVIGINLGHFYKMLKTIKKKDSLSLFVKKDMIDLSVKIQQSGDSTYIEKSIRITKTQNPEIDYDEKYPDPIVITSKDFQKIKSLSKISKNIKMMSDTKTISFSCSKDSIISGVVSFGEESVNNDEDGDENDNEMIVGTYLSENIIDLVKLSSLSSSIQIYVCKDKPLKLRFSVGSLGELLKCIKSNEIIMRENEIDNSE